MILSLKCTWSYHRHLHIVKGVGWGGVGGGGGDLDGGGVGCGCVCVCVWGGGGGGGGGRGLNVFDLILLANVVIRISVLFVFDISLWIRTNSLWFSELTPGGPVTHICVSNLTIIGSVNGLSPWRYQAIIWTNPGILLIGPLGTNLAKS